MVILTWNETSIGEGEKMTPSKLSFHFIPIFCFLGGTGTEWLSSFFCQVKIW